MALTSALGACGDGDSEVAVTAASDTEPVEVAEDGEAASEVYSCFGVTTTITELEEAPLVAELTDHPGVDAFATTTGDLDGWRAVRIEDERLEAIRELDPPEVLDGQVRDYERLVVELVEAAALPDSDEDRWEMASAGRCVLRADLGGLGPASVHLDGETALDGDATRLDLLVVEQACAGGEVAAGLVRVDVVADDVEIRLVVGVEPRGGSQTCPSNPPTPITVELDEPLAGRRVIDAGPVPGPRGHNRTVTPTGPGRDPRGSEAGATQATGPSTAGDGNRPSEATCAHAGSVFVGGHQDPARCRPASGSNVTVPHSVPRQPRDRRSVCSPEGSRRRRVV